MEGGKPCFLLGCRLHFMHKRLSQWRYSIIQKCRVWPKSPLNLHNPSIYCKENYVTDVFTILLWIFFNYANPNQDSLVDFRCNSSVNSPKVVTNHFDPSCTRFLSWFPPNPMKASYKILENIHLAEHNKRLKKVYGPKGSFTQTKRELFFDVYPHSE